MTDNNGKALREAKACLLDADVASVAGLRLKTALAALVEEIEAAPVVQAEYDDSRGTVEVVGKSDFCWNGQRVRVLAVGEQL